MRDNTLILDERFVSNEYQTKFARPMSSYLEKEIYLYCYFKKLLRKKLALPQLKTLYEENKKYPSQGNINDVIHTFLREQSVSIESTIHTVVQTQGRIFENQKLDKDVKICPFCLGKKGKLKDVLEVHSLFDIISHKKTKDLSQEEMQEKYIKDNKDVLKDIRSSFCYGCCRTIKEINNNSEGVKWPDYINENVKVVQRKIENKDLKDFVKDYFID